ncbi:translation initiation factor IF-2, mitochondrial isoform X2 [Thrips palmi]|uniref:Translation initiation factor IF-2, mitochondrial n=1 Tax=Thrips palmi TaxID=161013 RepID=A0A6P8ZVI7_THRPL|nr:translation initiation factor IF-2, mitochondrial isoform X2 [Thrips palmi]
MSMRRSMRTSKLNMAASLLRLKLIINEKNQKLISSRGFAASLQSLLIPSNDTACYEAHNVIQNASFHSSCVRVRSKSELEARKEFLLARLDKKKRERVEVWRNMSVIELATKLNLKPKQLLTILHDHVPEGHFYKSKADLINNAEILQDVVKFLGKAPVLIATKVNETDDRDIDAHPRPPPNPEDLVKRAPIVTIMGHVDHGKTTLLDYLRKANVVASEFGGITQHIGAFSVKLGNNDSVTFIDTPGHAAFSSMRSRGANVTDIVVLVVAADDGVMEQTIESIRMAHEAGATIIVAINKIDKPGANVKRTEEMLAQHQLYTENMGGEIQAIPISALNGTNVETLVEAILIQSEMMDLKGDPSGLAEGVIVESRQDLHKGKLATAIIQRGTLRKGAILVAGDAHAKVRLMFDEAGQQITQATPSTPVEMMGWRELPSAGEILLEVESEKRAQQVLSYRKAKEIKSKGLADQQVIKEKAQEQQKLHHEKRRRAYEQGLRSMLDKREKMFVEDNSPKLKVIIKGDVDGSVEAILDVLDTYHNPDVPLQVVHYGVGDTTPNDLELASLFKATIYCFNVRTPPKLKEEAKAKRVPVKHMNVIYHLIDDIKQEVGGKMPTVEQEIILGEADVIQQFNINEKRKKIVVAGLRVTKGEIVKSEKVKLVREQEVLYEGKCNIEICFKSIMYANFVLMLTCFFPLLGSIASLRHIKTEVNSMKHGTECGLMLGDSSIPVKLGDTIVCFKHNLVQKPVEWNPGF